MHTYKGKRATFIYNSDLSGDVTVVSDYTTSISGEDLIDFFTVYLRDKKISQLEKAETLDELLKL